MGNKLGKKNISGTSPAGRSGRHVEIIVPTEDPLIKEPCLSRVIKAELSRDFVSNKLVLGTGYSGTVFQATHKATGQQVAVKEFPKQRLHGQRLDLLKQEIEVYLALDHPHICRLLYAYEGAKDVWLVMELCGEELYDRLAKRKAYGEQDAADVILQMLQAVQYLHSHNYIHRDLKLENTLLDDSAAPRLKICDFGYSKSSLLHSMPKSTVGTPAYIAPEVLLSKKYDGKVADVWSCGVTLFVMLVGGYPFEDPADPRDYRKTIKRIVAVNYSIPSDIQVSAPCRDLLSKIFDADPNRRITISEIWKHEWFKANLPRDLLPNDLDMQPDSQMQSLQEIEQILINAKINPNSEFTLHTNDLVDDSDEEEESDDDYEDDDDEDETLFNRASGSGEYMEG